MDVNFFLHLSELVRLEKVSTIPIMDYLYGSELCSSFVEGGVAYTDSIHPSELYSDMVANDIISEFLTR